MKIIFGISLFLLTLVSVASCKDDEETITPDYVGSWIFDDSSVATFTANSIDVIHSNSSGDEKNLAIGFRGRVSVVGDLMTIVQTELGVEGVDGKISYYKAGTDEFIRYEGDVTPEISKYSVKGNELTLLNDDENDGVYGNGDGEILVLTRK